MGGRGMRDCGEARRKRETEVGREGGRLGGRNEGLRERRKKERGS